MTAFPATETVRLRLSPRGIGAGAAVTLAGVAALAAAWFALSPTAVEVMQAAVSAHDYSATRGRFAAEPTTAMPAGVLALMIRARLGDGDVDGALALLDRTPASDRIVRARQRAAILRAGRRWSELQQELERIAGMTDAAADRRDALAVARVRGDGAGERDLLAALPDRSASETERLAELDRAAGQDEAARRRLRDLLDAGVLPSPGATAALLAASWPRAGVDEIGRTLAAVRRLGGTVPADEQVVALLVAAGRPGAALDFAEATARAQPLALAAQRIDLLRRGGRVAEARALFARAAVAPGLDAATIIRIGFDLDAVPTILTALDAGRLGRLPPTLALDLARRAADGGRWAALPAIDRAATGDWRQLDPWFAMRLAKHSGDVAGALRYARLIDGQGSDAQEAVLRDSGDRAALRRLWLDHAHDGTARAAVADKLLADGDKADSVTLLRDAAATAGPASAAVKRLLYVWGPRPAAASLAWLRARARTAPDAGQRLAWLQLYAERDTPAAALAALATEPDAATTPVELIELDLAASAGDRAAQRRLVDRLLDGRALAAADLDRLHAALPDSIPAAQRLELTRRLLAAGRGSPQMQLDLAWDAFNRHRLADARTPLLAYLAARPADAAGLTLMASIEKAGGDAAAARSWAERALAAVGPAPSELRVQILEQLGRGDEALAAVAELRHADAGNDRLLALQARLLIAAGHPAAAQKLLAGRAT